MSTHSLSTLPISMAPNTQPIGSPVGSPSSSQHPPRRSATSGNPGDPSPEYVNGYPKLAYFFSQCPRYLHLRSFSALSIRALLFRQYELAHLERQLLALEGDNSRASDLYRTGYNTTFETFLQPSPDRKDEAEAHRKLYENLIKCTKEYEKALLRFDKLGGKGWNTAALQYVQKWLGDPEGNNLALSGLDARFWGQLDVSGTQAPDLIAVVEQPELSLIEHFLEHKFLTWSRSFPSWLRRLVFWSRKQPDEFNLWSHNARSFRAVSLALGNITTSIFVYGAVVSLSVYTSQVFGLLVALPVALAVTSCYLVFQNQQFISMLATLCAVLVALMANSDVRNPRNSG